MLVRVLVRVLLRDGGAGHLETSRQVVKALSFPAVVEHSHTRGQVLDLVVDEDPGVPVRDHDRLVPPCEAASKEPHQAHAVVRAKHRCLRQAHQLDD
eukprot:2799057-Prymnesium_polylepis.2